MKDYILVPSDRDGYMHLYLYDKNGKLIRQIDKGNYDVTEIYGYDAKTGNTYFQAAARKPMQREIYVADKSGKLTCFLLVRDGMSLHSQAIISIPQYMER